MDSSRVLKQEGVKVWSRHIGCDGEGGALGHPLVYLEIGDKNRIECPYCSKVFVYESIKPIAKHAAPINSKTRKL